MITLSVEELVNILLYTYKKKRFVEYKLLMVLELSTLLFIDTENDIAFVYGRHFIYCTDFVKRLSAKVVL